uniref:Uncharacterized protein n=1 Tax=Rhizophora mucronata TaxID=61149 RepID=A0A2P2PUN9_RHIMU
MEIYCIKKVIIVGILFLHSNPLMMGDLIDTRAPLCSNVYWGTYGQT